MLFAQFAKFIYKIVRQSLRVMMAVDGMAYTFNALGSTVIWEFIRFDNLLSNKCFDRKIQMLGYVTA